MLALLSLEGIACVVEITVVNSEDAEGRDCMLGWLVVDYFRTSWCKIAGYAH